MSRNNVVYQITCVGCNKTYIGKTDRCLRKRLSEHSTQHNTSAVALRFLKCKHSHLIDDLYDQYDQLNDLPSSSNISTSIKNVIFNNYKILCTRKSTNTRFVPFFRNNFPGLFQNSTIQLNPFTLRCDK